MKEKEYTNDLITSTSPYLLQHAHNPVNWKPWSEELVDEARKSNKLIIISIGYSACHWCHVMERECFEDLEVAEVMNKYFICIKVDREERPDVDHYYMSAVQLMQQRGGWPLNVIALPDGRPIWGGTYFPKEQWIEALTRIAEFVSGNRTETEKFANKLQDGIRSLADTSGINEETESPLAQSLEIGINGWKEKWDLREGGSVGAPKFPMPVTLDFLMYYGHVFNDSQTISFVKLTLEKMARGGIYDQIGGGFARYSVDDHWKVPHFEKMLYDNAQLIQLYSKAYRLFKNKEFEQIVYESVHFLKREMLDSSGAFYSALDADSEGVEGRFYVWSKSELEVILKSDYELFSNYYQVREGGNWEGEDSILHRNKDVLEFALEHGLDPGEMDRKIKSWKTTLLGIREQRIRPGLDDKAVLSWNALAIIGLLEAYKSFDDSLFYEMAVDNANFIVENMMQDDGSLFHTWKAGRASVHGFLEDYALLMEAFLELFEASGKEEWFSYVTRLEEQVNAQFRNEGSFMFLFSPLGSSKVLVNYADLDDNVIPASNSVMAKVLLKLYHIRGVNDYKTQVEQMLGTIENSFGQYAGAYANWGTVVLMLTKPYYEMVMVGPEASDLRRAFNLEYHPNVFTVSSPGRSNIPILKYRFQEGRTLIYVCEEGACMLPVETLEEALKLILD